MNPFSQGTKYGRTKQNRARGRMITTHQCHKCDSGHSLRTGRGAGLGTTGPASQVGMEPLTSTGEAHSTFMLEFLKREWSRETGAQRSSNVGKLCAEQIDGGTLGLSSTVNFQACGGAWPWSLCSPRISKKPPQVAAVQPHIDSSIPEQWSGNFPEHSPKKMLRPPQGGAADTLCWFKPSFMRMLPAQEGQGKAASSSALFELRFEAWGIWCS